MIFWIVIGLIILGIIIDVYMDEEPAFSFGFAIIGVFALLIGFAFAGPSTVNQNPPVDHVDSISHTDLLAVGDSDTVHGSFFLGSGVINGHQTITYVQDNGGWSSVGQVSASYSRIYEDDPAVPYMVYKQPYAHHWWLVPWSLPMTGWYEFHVPSGSVVQNFNIDVTE